MQPLSLRWVSTATAWGNMGRCGEVVMEQTWEDVGWSGDMELDLPLASGPSAWGSAPLNHDKRINDDWTWERQLVILWSGASNPPHLSIYLCPETLAWPISGITSSARRACSHGLKLGQQVNQTAISSGQQRLLTELVMAFFY